MAFLVNKEGIEEEINYYELEEKCKEIVSKLEKEQQIKFLEYSKDYKYFSPYFDFVILELGYSIKNPMGYEGILTSIGNVIQIVKGVTLEEYENKKFNSLESMKAYMDPNKKCRFPKCDDKTLKIGEFPLTGFEDCIIDKDGKAIYLNLSSSRHNDFATLILNQMIIKSKNIYDSFCSYKDIQDREISFLEELGFVRIGVLSDYIVTSYNKDKLSDYQKKYLDYLRKKGYLLQSDDYATSDKTI